MLEPNVECCNAMGGNVVPFNQWAEINQTWTNEINQTYQDLFDPTIDTPLFITREMMRYINEYTVIKNDLEKLFMNFSDEIFEINYV